MNQNKIGVLLTKIGKALSKSLDFSRVTAALKKQNVEKILILPLYSQYSAATTASTFDAVARTLAALIKKNTTNW